MYESKRRLPQRELVFIMSLMYHGFRLTYERKNFKKRKAYVVPATKREDASGVDLWVKMPGDMRLYPLQVTQRGIKMFRKYKKPSAEALDRFVAESNLKIRMKQKWCKKYRIAFVLVRDFDRSLTNTTVAWGDVKALRKAIAYLNLHGPAA